MKVVYWSDYSCPFCYIGEARLKKAAEEAGVNIVPEMKAFQLDPTARLHAEGDTVTRFAKKYGLSMESAAHRIDMISEMGRDEGIDFRYATTLFTNTMDAHRLTKFAFYKGGPVLAEQIAKKLYAAYFTDNLELADHSVLKRIAMECGLDEADIDELLASDRYKDEVLLDEREAQRYQIYAVPYFLVNGVYAISGADSVEHIREILERAKKDEAPSESEETGMHCGPDGCHF